MKPKKVTLPTGQIFELAAAMLKIQQPNVTWNGDKLFFAFAAGQSIALTFGRGQVSAMHVTLLTGKAVTTAGIARLQTLQDAQVAKLQLAALDPDTRVSVDMNVPVPPECAWQQTDFGAIVYHLVDHRGEEGNLYSCIAIMVDGWQKELVNG